jgi:hypothetical protein
MAISQLFKFLGGAYQLAKLDAARAFPGETIAPEDLRYHRLLVSAGKVGAAIGALAGVWVGYELYMHPDGSNRDAGSMMMAVVFAPLMMVAAGLLSGVSWVGLFAPNAFLRSRIGRHWMKLCGTKSAVAARIVAALTSLLTSGLFVFFPICAWLGKV